MEHGTHKINTKAEDPIEASKMTNTHTHAHRGMPSLAHGAAIAIATTLFIISVQHFLLASNQPEQTRMGMISRANQSYLRNHPRHDVDHYMPASSLIQGHDGFWTTSDTPTKDDNQDNNFLPSIWHDEFFSPLFLTAPC